jgi:hypothetical protein
MLGQSQWGSAGLCGLGAMSLNMSLPMPVKEEAGDVLAQVSEVAVNRAGFHPH